MTEFRIPGYDDEDIAQEVCLILLRILQSDRFRTDYLPTASFDTYCFNAVIMHFKWLLHQSLDRPYNPCNKLCPFFSIPDNDCCSKHIKEECPYYMEYINLIESGKSINKNREIFLDTRFTSNDNSALLVDDIVDFCKYTIKLSDKKCEKARRLIVSLLENNKISSKDKKWITSIISRYFDRQK